LLDDTFSDEKLPPKNSTFEGAGRKDAPAKSERTDSSPATAAADKTSPKKPKTKVLFLCIGNACRNQMAEAIARHIASDVIEASSAGLSPLGYIAGPTVAVLMENGVSCEGQTSKSVRAANPESADLLINMSGYEVKNRLEPKDLPVEGIGTSAIRSALTLRFTETFATKLSAA
jgi:hypothetical protein